MFNSYAYAGGGHASANNYLKINAISGTLVKNHPKSIFVIAKADDTIFDPTNPRCRFPNAEKYIAIVSRQGYHYTPGFGWGPAAVIQWDIEDADKYRDRALLRHLRLVNEPDLTESDAELNVLLV